MLEHPNPSDIKLTICQWFSRHYLLKRSILRITIWTSKFIWLPVAPSAPLWCSWVWVFIWIYFLSPAQDRDLKCELTIRGARGAGSKVLICIFDHKYFIYLSRYMCISYSYIVSVLYIHSTCGTNSIFVGLISSQFSFFLCFSYICFL